MRRPFHLLVLSLACLSSIGLVGCQSGRLPDPNDPAVIAESPEIMMRNLVNWRTRLDRRVARREISPEERDNIMTQRVAEYLELVSPEMATPENAWLYGDLYRDAGRWKEAYTLYNLARKSAASEDRRVNDSLRFSRAAAKLGRHDEALQAARSTFTAPPEEKAPILPAILYEVIPAAEESKNHPSSQYAKLLEEAVSQHSQTVVDAGSEPGQAFLAARPIHSQKAWTKIVGLYQAAGDMKGARAALARADATSRRSATL